MRQLVNSLVERNRQPSGRIVFPAQGFGHCGAALFAGIPCVENGIGMFVDPVDGKSAAIHENDGDGFSGRNDSFHQIFFGLRKIDAGAISAEEAGFADRHFLALKLTGDSDDGDDNVGIFRGRDGFR